MRIRTTLYASCAILGMIALPYALAGQQFHRLSVQDDFPFHSIHLITTEHGLSQSYATWMTQDRHGFLWFITPGGLNRFDGYSFRTWSYKANDSNSPLVGLYWGLCEDKDGKLWMSHDTKGIYSFDPVHEHFTHYLHSDENENSLAADDTWAIRSDTSDNIWIATSRGLNKLDPDRNLFTKFAHADNDTTTLSENHIYGLILDEHHPSPGGADLWIVNIALGVDAFNSRTGKVIRQFKFPYTDYTWSSSPIIDIRGKTKDVIWLGSNHHAIFGFDTQKQSYIRIEIERKCRSASHIIGLYTVLEDTEGNLWTLNDDNEIVYYEQSERRFYYYSRESFRLRFNNNDCGIFEDNNRKIWISAPEGLLSIDLQQKTFRRALPDLTKVADGDFVYAILQVRDGTTYIGSSQICTLNKQTGIYSPVEIKGHSPVKSIMRNYFEDSRGHIWISSYAGLYTYSPVTQKIHECKLRDRDGVSYPEGFYGMLEDHQGQYWAYGVVTGLLKFDPTTEIVEDYTRKLEPDSSKIVEIINGFIHSSGDLYFSWRHTGLVRYKPENDEFRIYRRNPVDRSTISSDYVTAYYESKHGILWLGTSGGGLNAFDPDQEKFKSFTADDGLGSNSIVSMTLDRTGQMWLGTNNGICTFMPPEDPINAKTKVVFRNYDSSDGLPIQGFRTGAILCDESGRIYLGTNGHSLFHFHPDDLKDNHIVPPIYLTEFYLNNKIIHVNDSNSILELPIEYSHEVRLKHHQNIISLSFSALNFVHPEKNSYAYQLEGYDKEWIYTNAANRRATYTNLDPGSYTFKVKGSNNDGIWNDVPRELSIIIIPAFWQTWWFRLAIVLVIASGIYALYRYRLNQVLKMQLMRNRIAHDLHDNIGSTLNSISIYSEVAQKKSEGRIPELDLIGESSRKVIDSMSDIVWTINPDNDSFSKIIFRMHSQTHYLMKAKGIEYSFKVDEALNGIVLPMQTRQHFYLIYKEAINNILKYSKASQVAISLTTSDSKVELRINDDGIGFDAEQLTEGNGLKSMKQRAKAIKADFTVTSRSGEGTNVMLSMPV